MAITPTPVRDVLADHEHLESAKLLVTPQSHRLFFRIVIGTLIAAVLAMFLPWQQFIEGKGEVTAFAPADRPQVVPSTIGGRIVEWYAQEGDVVTAGQPILRITEVKDDYLDPSQRTEGANEGRTVRG
jgi:membrane fusion protein, adhesin transport system